MSDADIAAEVNRQIPPSMLMMGVAGGNLENQQYLQEAAAARAAGQPFPGFEEWKTQHQAQALQTTTQAKDAQDAKDSARETFDTLDKTYASLEQNVEWLNDPTNRDAVVAAIQKSELLTSGQTGNLVQGAGLGGVLGIDQKVLDARARLNTLNNQLFTSGFTQTKNVRSNAEANKIGSSLTSLMQPTNSAEAIGQELSRLQNQTYTSRGNVTAAAGRQVPLKYGNLVDPELLTPRTRITTVRRWRGLRRQRQRRRSRRNSRRRRVVAGAEASPCLTLRLRRRRP